MSTKTIPGNLFSAGATITVAFSNLLWFPFDGEIGVQAGYNGGTALMFDAFAQSIFDNAETPIPLEVALNWTAAGLLSEKSADLDGVPVDIPGPAEVRR